MIFHQSNSIKINEQTEDKSFNKESKNGLSLKDATFWKNPGRTDTFIIHYHIRTKIFFNIREGKYIQINLHGINCKFDLEFNGTLLKKINLDIYSIKIGSNNNSILIKPLMDKIKGKYKEKIIQ